MSILYCRNCGAKIEYTLNKPIACYKCNQNLSIPSSSNKNLKKNTGSTSKRLSSIENISKKIKVSVEEDEKYPIYTL